MVDARTLMQTRPPPRIARTFMKHLDLLERIRLTVRSQWSELGSEAEQLEETILIRDGLYCGRRFRIAGLQAVWFFEEDELKFYDASGRMQRVLRPADVPHTGNQRVA